MDSKSYSDRQVFNMAGVFTLSLRLVTGWTYFSAFWRRLILEDKLDANSAGYVGEKFNHFLPHALFIKPGIEYLVTHPDTLWWFMLFFTITEAIVGLLFMLGYFTRLMSIGISALAMGILLGAGWLGTTCLDEWQIGVLGVAAGFTVFLSGGGHYSLDNYLTRWYSGRKRNLFNWLGSGTLNVGERTLKKVALSGALLITGITLLTNQYFHGGLWGKLHNLSIKPNIEITDTRMDNGTLSFTVFRNEGADVYGSYLIKAELYDEGGKVVLTYNSDSLSSMSPRQIANEYVAKVKPGKHSLVIPLGAKARLTFTNNKLDSSLPGIYTLKLTDISGITWTTNTKKF